MRQLILLFAALSLFALPAWAQDSDASVFQVTDVPADVTAASAVKARDQALIKAQRTAFLQLLERLGASTSVAKDVSDDDVAAMVQSFEVQDEHRSSVRYIGTFTVQFRPNAVRELLSNRGATYTETRSNPVVILPVLNTGSRLLLWEETTKWRMAWENNSRNAGLVPVVVPTGGLDDIATVSTVEAVNGKAESIKAIIGKYHADSAAVVTLTGDLEQTKGEFQIDIVHYDAEGNALSPTHLKIAAPKNKNGLDATLGQAARMVRNQLEKDWRDGKAPSVEVATETYTEPTNRLPVTVPIVNLSEWAQINRRLGSVPNVSRTDVITLARGTTNIEIEFHGSIDDLQTALLQQGLSLMQDSRNGIWILQAGTL